MSLGFTLCYCFYRPNIAAKDIKTLTQNINFRVCREWIPYSLGYTNQAVVNLFYLIFHFTLLKFQFTKKKSIESLHKYFYKKKDNHGSIFFFFFCFETFTLIITTVLKVCECCKNYLDNHKLILELPKLASRKNNVTKGMMIR